MTAHTRINARHYRKQARLARMDKLCVLLGLFTALYFAAQLIRGML